MPDRQQLIPPGLEPIVSVCNVTKHFGGVAAVSDVSFALHGGEVVALAGENGAGKSTVKNIIGGILRPETGRVQYAGGPDAKSAGVATIHQETSLFPDLTVAENIMISRLRSGHSPAVRPARLRRVAAPLLERVGAEFTTQVVVRDLSAGQRQLVEIAKALAAEPRAIVFDEPTASLNLAERALIMQVVEQLRLDGVAVLYISHYLEEITRLSQRVVVMRDGRVVADQATDELDRPRLEALMVGRELAQGYPAMPSPRPEIALRVAELSDGSRVSGVSFEIAEGEIFGLAGLMGSGRTEVARAIFGLAGKTGRVELGGARLRRGSVRASIDAGMAFVTEDRRGIGTGVVLGLPVPILLAAVTAVAGGLVFARTGFGRQLQAVGSNRDAAVNAGLPVKRVVIGAYAVAGLLAGIDALTETARLGAVQPSIGQGYELTVITAVVLGGTSLFGGRGSVTGTVLGSLLLSTVQTGLVFSGASPYVFDIVRGSVLLAAVLAAALRWRRLTDTLRLTTALQLRKPS